MFNVHDSYLFDQVDGLFEIHTEIDEFPVDSFLFVFFLFQHEHVVVEELLQFLVCQVDANLLEGVVLYMKIEICCS